MSIEMKEGIMIDNRTRATKMLASTKLANSSATLLVKEMFKNKNNTIAFEKNISVEIQKKNNNQQLFTGFEGEEDESVNSLPKLKKGISGSRKNDDCQTGKGSQIAECGDDSIITSSYDIEKIENLVTRYKELAHKSSQMQLNLPKIQRDKRKVHQSREGHDNNDNSIRKQKAQQINKNKTFMLFNKSSKNVHVNNKVAAMAVRLEATKIVYQHIPLQSHSLEGENNSTLESKSEINDTAIIKPSRKDEPSSSSSSTSNSNSCCNDKSEFHYDITNQTDENTTTIIDNDKMKITLVSSYTIGNIGDEISSRCRVNLPTVEPPRMPKCIVCYGNNSDLILETLRRRRWWSPVGYNGKNYNLFWEQNSSNTRFRDQKPANISRMAYNHIQNHELLTTKKGLYLNLKQ